MSKHTPGPWKIGEYDPIEILGVRDGASIIVGMVMVPHSNEGGLADARLIAAAPDLLEACRWLAHTSCDVGKSGDPPTPHEHEEAIKACIDAIAKAEGDL